MQTSARNQFAGPVIAIKVSPCPGGQHVITAVITDDSVKRLGLGIGQQMTAVFKAFSVFLASTD